MFYIGYCGVKLKTIMDDRRVDMLMRHPPDPAPTGRAELPRLSNTGAYEYMGVVFMREKLLHLIYMVRVARINSRGACENSLELR